MTLLMDISFHLIFKLADFQTKAVDLWLLFSTLFIIFHISLGLLKFSFIMLR